MTMQGMNIGRMDRRIVLQVNTPTQDVYGEPIESWSTIATVWANVRPVTTTESFAGQQKHATGDTEFRIRWRSDVDTLDRISYNSLAYDITGVQELGRREGLLIQAKVRELP